MEVCETSLVRKLKMPGGDSFYREIPSSKRHPARPRAPDDTSGSTLFLWMVMTNSLTSKRVEPTLDFKHLRVYARIHDRG